MNDTADNGGTTQAAACPYLEAGFASIVVYQLHTDIVNTDNGRIFIGHRIDRNLELAGQVGEFRIEG